jgi:hypothetical protein
MGAVIAGLVGVGCTSKSNRDEQIYIYMGNPCNNVKVEEEEREKHQGVGRLSLQCLLQK